MLGKLIVDNEVMTLGRRNGWEIERKFFLGRKFPLHIRAGGYETAIEQQQGYISVSPEIRLRREAVEGTEDRYFLTGKTGDGMVRKEDEHEISSEEFHRLGPRVRGVWIHKTRYIIPNEFGSLVFDLYKKPGILSIVEIEFLNEQQAMAFIVPSWMKGAIEVTDDKRFKARNIAWEGIPTFGKH